MTSAILARIPVFTLAIVLAPALTDGAAEAQTYPYRALDLGVPPGQNPIAGVGASAISPDGSKVAGTSVWEGYVWERGTGMRSLQKLAGLPNATPQDVNDAGFAVGTCGLPTVSIPTTAVLWDPQGTVRSIGGLGGLFSWCTGINNAGTVIGGGEVVIGGSKFRHAFTWTASGGIVDLTPGAASNSTAYDINDAGQICLLTRNGPQRFTPGTGMLPTGNVAGHRINEYGQMAGKDLSTGTAGRYTDGIGWEMFAAGSQIQLSDIGGINGLGQIGGTQSILQHSSPPSYERHGYLYTFGLGFQRLDDWIDPQQRVTVRRVHGITDAGVIVADGSIGPDNRALLLEPTSVGAFGDGCAGGSGRAPKLGAAGWPRAGGRIAVLGAGGPGNGTGLLVFSARTAAVPLPGGCRLLVDPAVAVAAPVPLNPIGQGSLVLTVPNGVRAHALFVQLVTLDPAAPAATLAASNGVRIDVR